MGLLAYRCRCSGSLHWEDQKDSSITTVAMDLKLALVKSAPATRPEHIASMDQPGVDQTLKARTRPLRARRRTVGERCRSPETHTAHGTSMNHDQKESMEQNSSDNGSTICASRGRGKSSTNSSFREHKQYPEQSPSGSIERLICSKRAGSRPVSLESSQKATRRAGEKKEGMPSSLPLQERPGPPEVLSAHKDDHHDFLHRLSALQRTRDDKQVADIKDQQDNDRSKVYMPTTRKPRAPLQLFLRLAASMNFAPSSDDTLETAKRECPMKDESGGSQRLSPEADEGKGFVPSCCDDDDEADNEEDDGDECWDDNIPKQLNSGTKENLPTDIQHLSVNYYFVPRSQREYQSSRPSSPPAFRLSNGNNRFQLFDKPVLREGCPIISVTDPNDVVKYPDDLHYYFDEILSDEEEEDYSD